MATCIKIDGVRTNTEYEAAINEGRAYTAIDNPGEYAINNGLSYCIQTSDNPLHLYFFAFVTSRTILYVYENSEILNDGTTLIAYNRNFCSRRPHVCPDHLNDGATIRKNMSIIDLKDGMFEYPLCEEIGQSGIFREKWILGQSNNYIFRFYPEEGFSSEFTLEFNFYLEH